MLQIFFKLSKFIPFDCYKTVFDINYNKLYESGKRIILMDIDNTLISYDESLPTPELIALFEEIKAIGFKIIFISNNRHLRISRFAGIIGESYVHDAWKPFKKGYKQAIKIGMEKDFAKYISIGDQLMTDVLGSNRMGIDVILVKALKKKSEKWYTKVNRMVEKRILKKMKKHHPDVYQKIEGIYQ